MDAAITAMGRERFFDEAFGAHADLRKISERVRAATIEEWSQPGAMTAMLNWYRATGIVVPEPGEKAHLPLWTHLPFPKVKVPTLVIWALKDAALLPVQLEGLDERVRDLRLHIEPGAGHFITWEKPEVVTAAIRDFMAEEAGE
jgi:pimeloyl-ACP methyl ester carboxylesterase